MAFDGWHWRRAKDAGAWGALPVCARPLVAAAPWVSLVLVLAALGLADKRLADARGLSVALPVATDEEVSEVSSGRAVDLVATVMPVAQGAFEGEKTYVFFDDARYELADSENAERLAAHLGRAAEGAGARLVVFADVRIAAGQLLRFVNLARRAGIERVQIAERRP